MDGKIVAFRTDASSKTGTGHSTRCQTLAQERYATMTRVYVCTEHTQEIGENSFVALEPIFAFIRECDEGRYV